MNTDYLLNIITAPVADDYFPGQFIEECNNFKNINYFKYSIPESESLLRFKHVIPEQWHRWFETYIQLNKDGQFPSLWPFTQEAIAFDFRQQLDDFNSDTELFALGSDPSGDWFVMTQDSGSMVYLCDQYAHNLYDGWKDPNHLLAWACRSALADENNLTKEAVLNYWTTRNEKADQATIERIADNLN